MIIYLFLSTLSFIVGCQIALCDFKLLTNLYNRKIGLSQHVTYFCFICGLLVIIYDFTRSIDTWHWIMLSAIAIFISIFTEWLLSRLNIHSKYSNTLYRITIVIITAIFFFNYSYVLLTPFILQGMYFRNTFLGVADRKSLIISQLLHPLQHKPAIVSVNKPNTFYNVNDYGIVSNSKDDQLTKLQQLIDKIGEAGGGVIYFPRGRYFFNKNRNHKQFIEINHSNITITGETDDIGSPLAELICCNPMPDKAKNPWINPFFITTGEKLQTSNQFWGLQFRKKKDIITQSNSLSDSGSDGSLQTPDFCTKIIKKGIKGERMLKVEDSSNIGKYILIGMYNTSTDGNLLKNLLGVEGFRSEWDNALRAGPEEAPSFQWLVEVARIVDAHTIELCQPLFYPIDLRYDPTIFNVKMLENINIKNLQFSSHWNGVFHHHGFPLYYSVSQSREMDYGWNCINMKRTAHSTVSNIIIKNFTNPLYLQDSHKVEVSHLHIGGHDGHQGLKLYCHTSHCTIYDIIFTNHYADMMGCEGNSYCNIFSDIHYINPEFNPVDFDFHGFAEGPMSPPSHNYFSNIKGFRYIKGAGAIFNQPAIGRYNSWYQIKTEGERKGANIFYSLPYRPRSWIVRQSAAIATAMISVIKSKHLGITTIRSYRDKLNELKIRASIPRSAHRQLFKDSILKDITTTSEIPDS